jgi:hypothetical protein
MKFNTFAVILASRLCVLVCVFGLFGPDDAHNPHIVAGELLMLVGALAWTWGDVRLALSNKERP